VSGRSNPALTAPRPSRRRAAAAAQRFEVEFWGVRGSIPAPGARTRRYGGNTPCIEVRCGEEVLIFDLGTGVRELGERLVATGKPVRASVFLSHYHYDHLQGLPFFIPIFDPRNAFTFYGAVREGRTVRDVVAGQMVQPYFPVTAEATFRAKLDYVTVAPGEPFEVGGARVSTFDLNHPGGSLGFRIDFAGRSLVYATDVERGSPQDAAFSDWARGADVLIYDAQYTDDEYEGRVGPRRVGWGHSTWKSAVEAADQSGARRLVLFHHEPTRDDAGMDRLVRAARKVRPEAVAAKESLVLAI
jgi:phosphoribosyl 1,2-cyclic phosphodiesterase